MLIKIQPDRGKVLKEMRADALRAWETGEYQGEVLGFANLKLLFDVFTPNRWTLIETLQRTGPSSLRGLSRALGRDVKRVHEDANILLTEGIIERTDDNKLFVPFSSIKIEAEFKAPSAAA
jgi:predicted transcriptional regulator